MLYGDVSDPVLQTISARFLGRPTPAVLGRNLQKTRQVLSVGTLGALKHRHSNRSSPMKTRSCKSRMSYDRYVFSAAGDTLVFRYPRLAQVGFGCAWINGWKTFAKAKAYFVFDLLRFFCWNEPFQQAGKAKQADLLNIFMLPTLT